ncbi:MAG: GTP-binding protein RBG1/RBG2 [Candidatus Woesebacteria bacterium]|nr:MAG: GTP-binding protein RBG1/RBG2 [Candidatus Woesebacteria bacterium]
MADLSEQIEAIEKEIRETPYHKGTEHHIGLLRARIARLKDKMLEVESRKSGGGAGYAVKKQGDATIVLVGPPSVGKSTLINQLTNANSKIAPYAFTTVSVIPGMMEYKNARIQILDVPGLIEGAEEGKGRGKEVLSVIRGCNLLLIITEPSKFDAFSRIAKVLEKNGIRINKEKPEIKIEKKLDGGIKIFSNIRQDLDKETIKSIIQEMGIKNAEVKIKQKIKVEDLIDSLSRNRVYLPAIFVTNKADLMQNMSYEKQEGSEENPILISAKEKMGLERLLEKIWEKLELINIYLVKSDAKPSNDNPMVVKRGISLLDVAYKISEEFAKNITAAIIWGNGAKFPGQKVSLETKVEEGMQIRFI